MSGATIAGQVGEIKKMSAEKLPESVLSAFGGEQAELVAAGVPATVVATGTVLPDADLLDAHGESLALSGALGDGLSVLVFYRGAWCPFCNLALRTYQTELLPALVERGVSLVAISPQAPDGSLSMREKNELEFAVLSDPGSSLARAGGFLTEPSADSRAAQKSLGLDLTAVNADGTAGIPMPTVAIVDSARTVRWIDVHPDYTTRSEPEEIIVALDALRAAAPAG